MASRVFSGCTEKPIGQVLYEVKEEAREFIATRVQMARAEMAEKAAAWKTVAFMAAAGGLLAAMTFVLLSMALVAALAGIFGNAAHAWAAAFAIVGVLNGLAGAVCLAHAARVLRSRSLMPERTLRVLKQDQIWIQTERGCNHDRSPANRNTGAACGRTAATAS